MFSKITSCYVKIGLLVVGVDLLYFSQHKSTEGKGNVREEGLGNGKKNFGEYEPKANEKTSITLYLFASICVTITGWIIGIFLFKACIYLGLFIKP
jgi:hypothetical protein